MAILPDGNRRWARRHGLVPSQAHRHGFGRIPEVLRWCQDSDVDVVSLFMISDENVRKRSQEERLHGFAAVRDLLAVLLAEPGWRIGHVGDPALLPAYLVEALARAQEASADRQGLRVNLGLGYGGRAEILTAVRRAAAVLAAAVLAAAVLAAAVLAAAVLAAAVLAAAGGQGGEVTEEFFSRQLSTAGQPDPDLVVRTSGEMRTSGFMPWQATQAEWFFTEKLWPDFGRADLESALAAYGARQRRLGA
ncbi:undecaprenyl diphosphate synthase family protein [Streptomyces xanthophaeus]